MTTQELIEFVSIHKTPYIIIYDMLVFELYVDCIENGEELKI